MVEKFEDIKTPEETVKTSFEGREGKKFSVESLDAQNPELNKVQNILENGFQRSEIDSFEVLQKAVAEEDYHVHVAKDVEGKIQGVFNSGIVETRNDEGEALKGVVHFLGHVFTMPGERGQGILKNLSQEAHNAVVKDLGSEDKKEQGLKLKATIAEAHGQVEKTFNEQLGLQRPYIQTEGGYSEVPYKQPYIEYDKETGKPVEGTSTVPEHLMVGLESGKKTLSGTELKRMVNGVYDYNYYQEKSYFKNPQAYDAHNEIVDGIKKELTDFVGKNTVHLFSATERIAMQAKGIKFIEHQAIDEIKQAKEQKIREGAYEIHQKREAGREKGYTWGETDKMLRENGLTPGTEGARKFLEEWDWLQAEKKEIESAKIPKESVKTETILKEAGIEKPAESFQEVQKRLKEKIEDAGGANLSLTAKNELVRNFYLGHLGYSIKYDFFHGKAMLWEEGKNGEEGKYLSDKQGKRLEFKTAWSLETKQTPLADFLQERLKEQLSGKPDEKLTEEQKLDKGVEGAVKKIDLEQTIREGKIAFVKARDFSAEQFNKLRDGVMRLSSGLWERMGPGFRAGKKLAIEGGKDLAAAGLSPAAALETVARKFWVGIEIKKAIWDQGSLAGKITEYERKPYSENYTDLLRERSGKFSDKINNLYDTMYRKGKTVQLIEKIRGNL